MAEVATAGSPTRYILAPYLATPPEVVERMLDLAGVSSSDVVYDLGCGDGRIVVAAALRGARGVGVDIEPYWIEKSRKKAAAAGVEDLVSFGVQDALTVDLAPATVVMLYLVEWSTRMLGAKLAAELRPGSRVVSHSFTMGDQQPEKLEQWVDASGQARTLRLWIAGSGRRKPTEEPLAGPSGVPGSPIELADLTLARLQPFVGSAFSVALGAPWDLELRLSEVSPLSKETSFTGAFRAPFRMIFHGPAHPVHPQQTLPLDHPQLGRVEIFLVPIGPDASGMRYEAIFT